LTSGLSWLAWSLEKPVVLISGISKENTEFFTPYRVTNTNVCHGCTTEKGYQFDRGDWMFCPKNKNFECTSSITFEMVKEKIDKLIKDRNLK
jgi:autotransporter strand-loop-strand O-heptosyltransferase